MIEISNISKKSIKEFAGEIIYIRGLNYFQDNMVENFEYDPKLFSFQAMVNGSYGSYDVEIWTENGYIKANCNCPFDGYPCKHIISVLLYFAENKNKYLKELEQQSDLESKMNNELSGLTKDELIKMIISLSNNHLTIKRELLMHLSIDDEKSFRSFDKAIDTILNKCERNHFSTYEISRDLKKILKQVEVSAPEFQIKVLWKIANGVLFQLNEYGMNDIPFEQLGIYVLDKLVKLCQMDSNLKEKHPEILSELKEYCDWHNCGITDEICNAYYTLIEDNC